MESISGANEFECRLLAALQLAVPYSERLLIPAEKPAAVMLLLGKSRRSIPENPSGMSILLTRRTEAVENHKGQMAFPGGRAEPEEILQGCLIETALRETEEEVGIPRQDIRVIGMLPELSIVTGFRVQPFVGILKHSLEETTLKVNAGEIAELVWIPWSVLNHPSTYRKEMVQRGPIRFPTHVYQVGEHRIWGATGAMIKNLLDRWAALGY